MKTNFCRILTAIALFALLISISAVCVVQAQDTGYNITSAYASRTDKGVSVKADVDVTAAQDNATVYLASYSIEGKLLAVKVLTCPAESDQITYSFNDEASVNLAYSVKVMLLDGNMSPLSVAHTCVIKDSDNILDVGPLFK